MDWLDLLAVQGMLKSSLTPQPHVVAINHMWPYLKFKLTNYAKGEVCGEGMVREFGMSRCKLLIRMDTQQVLPYSTGDYSQHPVKNRNRIEHEKECLYMYN